MKVAFWIIFPIVVIMITSVVLTTVKFNNLQEELLSPSPVHDDTIRSTKSSYAPTVYEVLYYNRDADDKDMWVILKSQGKADAFVRDVKAGRINHAMVYGRLYTVKYLSEDAENAYINFKDNCGSDTVYFSNCKPSYVSLNANFVAILHVLGFMIDQPSSNNITASLPNQIV